MGMAKSTYYFELSKTNVVAERNKELSATIKEITFDQNEIVSLFVTDEDGMSFENDIDVFYLSYKEAEKALED